MIVNPRLIYQPRFNGLIRKELIMEDKEKFDDDAYDKLRDDGYKDYDDYIRQRSYERAVADYERQLRNPYDY